MAAEQQHAKAGGSRFAATCGLLRQYMKEQGGSGARCLAPAVAMGLLPGADVAAEAPEERKTILELFPQQAGTLKDSEERRTEPETAPLTIFYGGKMVVFDGFPAEKAEELMQLAGSCNVVSPAASAAGAAAVRQDALGQPSLTVHVSSDMPIARKVSLQRFLEKRKARLTAGDPYPAAASESSKPMKDDGAPSLGANSMLSLS